MAIITLTSDFGLTAPYVAVMKGVILSIDPDAAILDLSHSIRPQDLRHAGYFLRTTVPHFPQGTIHVAVIDPGVGSERRAIYAEAGGQRLVGPDNGIFTGVFQATGGATRIHELTNHRFWRPQVSDTFHGRDIFAPVAAHLSRGVDPCELGPELANPVELPSHSAVTFGQKWEGEVQFVDDFGNLITNIPSSKLKSLPLTVSLGGSRPEVLAWVRTYSEAAPGQLVCLFSSDGYYEIAEVNGNAARRLGADVGTVVVLEWS
jgi:S-adenosylmethionine hydrolase